jgi:hypothetical protein
MLRRLVIALMLFGLASSANAATVILRNYKAHQNDDQAITYKTYLDGVREGFIAFNEELARTGGQRLFCMPRNLALTVEQADDIMMREAAKMTNPDEFYISLILLHGLKDTFPCDEKHQR